MFVGMHSECGDECEYDIFSIGHVAYKFLLLVQDVGCIAFADNEFFFAKLQFANIDGSVTSVDEHINLGVFISPTRTNGVYAEYTQGRQYLLFMFETNILKGKAAPGSIAFGCV
jgi:hypothetical protein